MSGAMIVIGAMLMVVGAAALAWQAGLIVAGLLLLLAGLDEALQ